MEGGDGRGADGAYDQEAEQAPGKVGMFGGDEDGAEKAESRRERLPPSPSPAPKHDDDQPPLLLMGDSNTEFYGKLDHCATGRPAGDYDDIFYYPGDMELKEAANECRARCLADAQCNAIEPPATSGADVAHTIFPGNDMYAYSRRSADYIAFLVSFSRSLSWPSPPT